MSGKRRGFTLVEVSIGLTISGVALVIGSALLAVAIDMRMRISDAEELQRRRNVDAEWPARLLERVDLTANRRSPLSGSPERCVFESSCEEHGGWLAPCEVRFDIRGASERGALLVVFVDNKERLRIPLPAARWHFLYGGRGLVGNDWVREWEAGITAPRIVALVSATDSLFLTVGARR